MDKFREQSVRFGTRIYTETVTDVNFSHRPFTLTFNNQTITADSIIVATGATARRLNLPGETEYWNKGISACAVCDGAVPIFREKPLAVIGGGDTAAEEALFLTRYGSVVNVLHRRDKLRASKVMADRLLANKKIKMHWNTVATEAAGNGKLLTHIKTKDTVTGEEGELQVSGLFYGIGHDPNTKFLQGKVDLHEDGYVKVGNEYFQTATSVEGVFACGDVQDKKYRQAVTAAGNGCMAALECTEWLEEHKSIAML